MQGSLPEPGQALRPDGPPAVPREAATVIVVRGAGRGLEVLLVQRNPAARFMGGAWVFPGGAVDPGEGAGDAAHRRAGVREVAEEAGLRLPDPAALVPFSRWITPPEVAIRFDTYFYLAPAPPGQEPRADGQECVDWGWFTPAGALDGGRRGALLLVFPTVKHLEQLAAFPTADALLSWARGRRIEPVRPRLVGETARIVLPGEPDHG